MKNHPNRKKPLVMTPDEVRALRGTMTQAEFAELCCRGKAAYVSDFETGRRPIPLDTVQLVKLKLHFIGNGHQALLEEILRGFESSTY